MISHLSSPSSVDGFGVDVGSEKVKFHLLDLEAQSVAQVGDDGVPWPLIRCAKITLGIS